MLISCLLYTCIFLLSFVQSLDFDALIFSQHWPKTLCSQWEEQNESNTCEIPDHNLWTIHGIWPTMKGSDNGPQNCKNSSKFNPTALSSIETDLDQFWTNVEANTEHYSFWRHEWDKHGTCASKLQELSTELKYFEQGLIWNKDFNIRDLLEKSLITPNDKPYNVEFVYNSIQTLLVKRPMMQCIIDRKTKELFLSEIRICFGTNFSLVDCDLYKTHESAGILTNCDLKKPMFYVDTIVPLPHLTCSDRNIEAELAYTEKLLSIHYILQFLIWFTI